MYCTFGEDFFYNLISLQHHVELQQISCSASEGGVFSESSRYEFTVDP